jgi:hypothetical protein
MPADRIDSCKIMETVSEDPTPPCHPVGSQNCHLQTFGNCEWGPPNTFIPLWQQTRLPPANFLKNANMDPTPPCQQPGLTPANLWKLWVSTQTIYTNLPAASIASCKLMETVSEDPTPPCYPVGSQDCLLQTYENWEWGPNTSRPLCRQTGFPSVNLWKLWVSPQHLFTNLSAARTASCKLIETVSEDSTPPDHSVSKQDFLL